MSNRECVAKLASPFGLEYVKLLHAHDPKHADRSTDRLASSATAVEAIELGACHYLAKPSNADDIEAAFAREEGDTDLA